MSKWPELTDRRWPSDIPSEYLVALQEGGVDTLKATAMVAVILGLMRRVDRLEQQREYLQHQIDELENRS